MLWCLVEWCESLLSCVQQLKLIVHVIRIFNNFTTIHNVSNQRQQLLIHITSFELASPCNRWNQYCISFVVFISSLLSQLFNNIIIHGTTKYTAVLHGIPTGRSRWWLCDTSVCPAVRALWAVVASEVCYISVIRHHDRLYHELATQLTPMYIDFAQRFRASVAAGNRQEIAAMAPRLHDLFVNFISTFSSNTNSLIMAEFAVVSAELLRYAGM